MIPTEEYEITCPKCKCVIRIPNLKDLPACIPDKDRELLPKIVAEKARCEN